MDLFDDLVNFVLLFLQVLLFHGQGLLELLLIGHDALSFFLNLLLECVYFLQDCEIVQVRITLVADGILGRIPLRKPPCDLDAVRADDIFAPIADFERFVLGLGVKAESALFRLDNLLSMLASVRNIIIRPQTLNEVTVEEHTHAAQGWRGMLEMERRLQEISVCCMIV